MPPAGGFSVHYICGSEEPAAVANANTRLAEFAGECAAADHMLLEQEQVDEVHFGDHTLQWNVKNTCFIVSWTMLPKICN